MEKFNIFNVSFVDDKNLDDETQFDIPAEKNEKEAKEEIIKLFSQFCKENDIPNAKIVRIEQIAVEQY